VGCDCVIRGSKTGVSKTTGQPERATTARESTIVRSILALRSPDLVLVKVPAGPRLRGCPDLIGCWRGHALALEVKRPGQQPTALQAATLAAWARAGAIAAVVHSAAEVREILNRGSAGSGPRTGFSSTHSPNDY